DPPLSARLLIFEQPLRTLAIPFAFLLFGPEILPFGGSADGGNQIEVVERVGGVLKAELVRDPGEASLARLLRILVFLAQNVLGLGEAEHAGERHGVRPFSGCATLVCVGPT